MSCVVITSEARNLLLLALETVGRKQQIPHGLKAVRDDNQNRWPLLMQQSIKPVHVRILAAPLKRCSTLYTKFETANQPRSL